MIKTKLGEDEETGEIITITEAENGLNCGCICPDCKSKLQAIQGSKKEWHFRHSEEANCKGGDETALHKLAKEIIADNNHISLTDYGIISYSNPIKEKKLGDFRPDITVEYKNGNLFFEVWVNHKNEIRKDDYYKTSKYKSIEIDLSNYKFKSREDLQREILENVSNKRIIYWEQNVARKENNVNYTKLLLQFSLLILIFLGVKKFYKASR